MTEQKYEWLEPVSHEDALKLIPKESYQEPDRDFDKSLKATKEYIATLPDLQNGPSSNIQGSPTFINQVGISNFKLPLKWKKKDGSYIELETKITGTVSLEAHKKGINMSRIIRSFYEHKENTFDVDYLEEVLKLYKENLQSFDAKLMLNISYPLLQESLRSGMFGYQYYNITVEVTLNQNGVFDKTIHFDFVYSSACPCSFELAEHARKYRNKATVSHSQRSTARVSVKYKKHLWFEDVRDLCLEALKTETQVMVKREDEQAFAELNGSFLKFVEDAVRLLHEQFEKHPDILDYKIICSHNESLHSHDAVACIVKGVENGFTSGVSIDEYKSLIK